MIYLDTSVALAQLLAEDRRPPKDLWNDPLVSSRLIEYEMWTRLHALRASTTHGEAARALLGRVALLELSSLALARALEPFPVPVRTLDALHLASMQYLIERRIDLQLASYDQRMLAAAAQLEIDTVTL